MKRVCLIVWLSAIAGLYVLGQDVAAYDSAIASLVHQAMAYPFH